MTCKDVKDFVTEYAKVADEVKSICTNRACTLDAIQKTLSERGIEIGEAALTAVIAQIKEMMVFSKNDNYDIGATITYRKTGISGIIDGGEKIGNEIVRVFYKNFYLYSTDRCHDDAFREHIYSKLKFEEDRRVAIDVSDKLKSALESLGIAKEKWPIYVVIKDNKVYCKRWNDRFSTSSTEYMGKLIRRDPVK